MPECASTGCRCKRFAFVTFFSQLALYDGCVVFLSMFCLVLIKAPWSLESRLVS